VLVRNSVESSVANTTQIFIHTRSRAQLFSRICASLEQLDLSIHDARIYSANDSMILDTFYVLDSDGQPITEDTARHKHIKEYLTANLSTDATDSEVAARRTPRQMKSFSIPTETSMSVDEIKNQSVLEVRVEDMFFITDEHQNPITDPDICRLIQQTIRDELDEQAAA